MDLLQHLDLPNLSDSSDTDDFLQELAALNDAGLLRATMESLECGRLTPLIKEELRCRIQSRRLSEGKEELLVEFPSPTPSQPRPDEVQKRDRRREQNRRAAQKFRKKKKERGEHLIEETQRLESHNTSLRSEIKQLHEEREQLTRIIRSHASVCPLTPRQSPLTIIRESPLPGSIRGSPLTLPLTSASLLARSPVMGKSPVHGKSPVMSKSPVVVQSPVLLVPPTRESPVPLLIINAARESPIPGRVVPSSPVPMSGRPRKSPVSMMRINQSPIPGDKLGHKSPILFGSPPKQSKHSIPPRLNLAGPKPVVPILPKPAANSSPSPKTPMGVIMSPLPLAPSPVSVGGRALHMSPVFFGDGCFTPSSRTRQVSQSPISVTDSSSNSTPARMTQQSPVFFGERAPSTAHSGPHFLQPLSASSTSSTSSLASLLRQESPLSVLSNSSGVSNVSSVFVGNSQNSNNNQLDNNTFLDNTTNNNNIVSNNNINNNNSSSCNNNNNNSINIIFDPPSHFQPKSPFACSPNPASREHPDDNVLCLEDIERSATGYEARDDLIDFIDIQALLELSGDQNGNNQGDPGRAQRDGNQGVNQARHNFVEHDMCQVEDSLMEPSSTHNRDVDQSLNQVDVSGNGNEIRRGEKTMSSPAFDRQVKSQGVTEIAQSLLAIAQTLPSIAQNSSTFGVKDNDPNKLNGPNTPGQQGSVFDMETIHAYRDLNSGKETNGGFYHSPYVGHQDSAFRGTSLDQVGLSLRDYAKFSHDNSILNPASLASLHSSLRELLAAQNARMAQEQIESHANTDTHDSSSIHVSTGQLGQQTAINNDNDLPDDSNRCLSNSGFSQIGSDEHACSNDNSDSDYANLQSSFSLDMLMTSHSICSTTSDTRFSQVSHQYS